MNALPADTLFRCPQCRLALSPDETGYHCATGHGFAAQDGVVDLVPPSAQDGTSVIWQEHLEAFQRRREERISRPEDLTARASGGRDQQRAFADFLDLAGHVVLDIGCGPGKFRRRFQPGVRYVGVDPIPLLPDVLDFEFARAVSEHLPFDDATFSDIVILHALDHVKDIGATLREVSRVLEPSGRLHILQNVLDRNRPFRWLAHELKDFLEDRRDSHRRDQTPHHMAEFTSNTLLHAVTEVFDVSQKRYWAPGRLSPLRMMCTAERR